MDKICCKIENRQGEDYIVTDQFYKDKVITIKIDSVIKTQEVEIQDILLQKKEIYWIFSHNKEIDKYYIDLLIGDDIYKVEVNISTFVSEIVRCIQENKTLDSCIYISNKINEIFQTAFHCLVTNKNKVIYSDMPIDGYCVVEKKNEKVLGYASRFILKTNMVSLLEYAGKEIDLNDKVKINLYVEDVKAIFNVGAIRQDFSFDEDYKIGAFSFQGIPIAFLKDDKYQNKKTSIKRLNTLKICTTNYNYSKWILNNNSASQILSYKSSLKPRKILINITNCMIEEFDR